MAVNESNVETPILLKLLSPLRMIIPFVEKPSRKVYFREKCLWTIITLLIYLVACQIPLYGVIRSTSSDPLQWFRTVLASNRFTLMELGISPIVTSSMILQILVKANVLKIDPENKIQKKALESGQRALAMIAIQFEAWVIIRSGVYGTFEQLGTANVILIAIQLTLAGLLVLLLDEMLENGYGLGSGISLFIATNVSEHLFWKTFSPTTIHTAKGVQFEGVFVQFFKVLGTLPLNFNDIKEVLVRDHLANMKDLLVTVLLVLVAIYIQDFHLNIPLVRRGERGVAGHLPVRIMSTSTLPILVQSSVTSNFIVFSKLISLRYQNYFFARLLGRWAMKDGYYKPVGGFAYYIFPVHSLAEAYADPVHFFVSVLFAVAVAAAFSLMWVEMAQSSPQKFAKSLDKQGIQFKGKKRSDTVRLCEVYMNTSAIIGGICVALLSIAADIFGSVIPATGVLMTTNLIYNYYKLYNKREE